MSGLSYLCGYGYGSNSEESDCEYPEIKRPKLPAPDLSKVPVVSTDIHIDDPQLHGGRTRSFPHERGNWATFVYLKINLDGDLLKIVSALQKLVLDVDESCQQCEDFHISLSRTFVLKYHQITSFTNSLQTNLEGINRFELAFDSIKVYCNEENTRTFIALKVDHFSHKKILQISKKVDDILEEFKLPIFYEDPSFHTSILWIKGNKKTELTNILEYLNEIVTQEIAKSLCSVAINQVICKSGNKHFQYSLQ